MNWSRLVLITFGTGIVVSLTDWFFAGDWLHRRYTYPEVWRQGVEVRTLSETSVRNESNDESHGLSV